MPEPSPDLLLFTTEGCHLCEVATQLIASVIDLERIYVELVDIAEGADSDRLIETYGESIPVVQHTASRKEINWPFSAEEFQQWYLSLGEES